MSEFALLLLEAGIDLLECWHDWIVSSQDGMSGSFVGAVLGALAGYAISKRKDRKNRERQTLGHQQAIARSRDALDYHQEQWTRNPQFGDRNLTPQEAIGTFGPGAAVQGHQADPTLGNMSEQFTAHQSQDRLLEKQILGQLGVAEVQANAQRDVAEIKADSDQSVADTKARTDTRGQDILAETAEKDRVMRLLISQNDQALRRYIADQDASLNRKDLSRKEKEFKVLQEKHNLSKWQLNKAWVLRQRLMSMGPDNVLSLAITDYLASQGRWDPTKGKEPTLSDIAFVISQMLHKEGKINKEFFGLRNLIRQAFVYDPQSQVNWIDQKLGFDKREGR